MNDLPRSAWRTQEEIHRDRLRYSRLVDSKQKPPPSGKRDLNWFRNKRILLWTRKPGLGDMVMNAMCCDFLRRHAGLDVWFGCRNNPYDRHFPPLLSSVPSYQYQPDLNKYPVPKEPRGYEGGVDHTGAEHPFDFIMDFRYDIHSFTNTLFQSLSEFGLKSVPVPFHGLNFLGLPKVESPYDIVIQPNCGTWKPVRSYRRHEELVARLCAQGFSVLNLADHGRSLSLARVLAEVKAARLYIGVETGISHLVAGVHKQAIIIQAGIHRSAFWNIYDRTHIVEAAWPCGGRLCQARKHDECHQNDGVCVDRFSPEDITDLTTELLKHQYIQVMAS